MNLPSTIHTVVSHSAITRVTRLFNGSVRDVLAELLQNARRAGATEIDIEVLDLAGHPTLAVHDDGHGIDDPSAMVTLGKSGWGDEIAAREDPAGMGVFSLAGHRVEIRSYSRAAGQGWRVVIHPDDWESSAPLRIEPFDIERGTEILVDLPEAWERDLATSIRSAAMHYPLPVRFHETEQPRRDFLAGATHVEHRNGVRIGVFRETRTAAYNQHINFHGVTVNCPLPSVSEADKTDTWSVLIDIVDAPELQLVLPARKEMVQNAALDSLKMACKAAIFSVIASEPAHRLGFEAWSEARALGITLPEADPYMFGWLPPSNDSGYMGQQGEMVRGVPMIIMPDVEPDLGNSAARALADGKALGAQIVLEETCFEGYSWYDAIPKIADVQFVVTISNDTHPLFEDDNLIPAGIETGRATAIYLRLSFDGDALPTTYVPTDVLVIDPESFGLIDDVIVLLTPDTAITVNQLTELLQRAVFNDSDDLNADSYDTQEAEFSREAKPLAMTLLLGEEQAILSRIEDLLAHEAAFLRSEPRAVAVTLAEGKASARYLTTQSMPATSD